MCSSWVSAIIGWPNRISAKKRVTSGKQLPRGTEIGYENDQSAACTRFLGAIGRFDFARRMREVTFG
jgi:hypothetical protein